MVKEIEIVCPPGQQEDNDALKTIAATALNIAASKISALKILKRSIDARGPQGGIPDAGSGLLR